MAEFNWTADDIKRAQRDFSNNFMRLDCIRIESYDIAIDCMTECIESKAADVQPVDRWISVDEKLPKPFERVLCYCISTSGDDAYMIGCINKHWGLLKGETFVFEKETHRIVAYWQPLPPRPTIDYCHFCNEYLRTTKERIENDTL